MARNDHAELECARQKRHEGVWRLIGTFFLHDGGRDQPPALCRRRACKRSGFCRGPMVATPLQGRAIAREIELGLSGIAVACLPACIANMTRKDYDRFVERDLPAYEDICHRAPPARLMTHARPPNRWMRRLLGEEDRDDPDP